MYPNLFTVRLPGLGELTITSFGVMMALAFLVGYWIIRVELRRKRALGDPRAAEGLAADLLMGTLVGGIVGAKLYYVLLNWEQTAVDPLGMLFSRGGLVWYGGLAGGVLGGIWVLRRNGVEIAFGADAVAPALALSYAVGRIGCFLVGDDYGRPTDAPVGIAFPEGLPPTTAGNLRRHFGVEVDASIPDQAVMEVHPTQLYETGMALVIFGVLWRFRRHPHANGWLFGLWMVLAGLERLVVEFFRAKDDRFFGPLTLAQLLSVVLLLAGVYVLHRRRRGEAAARAPEVAGA